MSFKSTIPGFCEDLYGKVQSPYYRENYYAMLKISSLALLCLNKNGNKQAKEEGLFEKEESCEKAMLSNEKASQREREVSVV